HAVELGDGQLLERLDALREAAELGLLEVAEHVAGDALVEAEDHQGGLLRSGQRLGVHFIPPFSTAGSASQAPRTRAARGASARAASRARSRDVAPGRASGAVAPSGSAASRSVTRSGRAVITCGAVTFRRRRRSTIIGAVPRAARAGAGEPRAAGSGPLPGERERPGVGRRRGRGRLRLDEERDGVDLDAVAAIAVEAGGLARERLDARELLLAPRLGAPRLAVD